MARKLDAAQVQRIKQRWEQRAAEGVTTPAQEQWLIQQMASDNDVRYPTVSDIVCGISWKHVPVWGALSDEPVLNPKPEGGEKMRYLIYKRQIMDSIGHDLLSGNKREELGEKIKDLLYRFETHTWQEGFDEAKKRDREKMAKVFSDLFLEDDDISTRVDRLARDSHGHDEDYGR